MASIILRLDTRTKTQFGSQVRLRISNNQTTAYYPTGVYVVEEYFSNDLYCPLKKGAYMYAENKEFLADVVRKFEQAIFDLQRNGELSSMTAVEIRDYATGKTKKKEEGSFVDFVDRFGMSKAKKTASSYAYTCDIIIRYCTHARKPNICFTDVDYSFLKNLDSWMEEEGLGRNTRRIIMCNIRASWNEACRMKIVRREDYPFSDFTIRNVRSRHKKFVSVDGMRKLARLDLSGALARARDAAFISLFLGGMNLVDMYNLPKAEKVVTVRNRILSYLS